MLWDSIRLASGVFEELFSHPCQHTILSYSMIFTDLMSEKLYLVLICIFLITTLVEFIFYDPFVFPFGVLSLLIFTNLWTS